jgi:hypothetical protein
MIKRLFAFAPLMLLLSPVFANPIAIESAMNTTVFVIIVSGLLMFLTFTSIEFGIIYFYLRKDINKKWVELYKAVLLVNLIVFPATQIIALLLIQLSFKGVFFQNFHYFSELIPFVAEYFLLKWQFSSLAKHKILKSPIPDSTVLRVTIAANAVTFLLGVVFLTGLIRIGII